MAVLRSLLPSLALSFAALSCSLTTETTNAPPFDALVPPQVTASVAVTGPGTGVAGDSTYQVTVRLRNPHVRPRVLEYQPSCTVQVQLYTSPARTGTPAWTLESPQACPPRAPVTVQLASGGLLELQSRTFLASSLRTGPQPLAPGTYYVLASVVTPQLPGGVVQAPAGEIVVSR